MRPPQKSPYPWVYLKPHLLRGSLRPKWRLNQFSFCRAHRVPSTHVQTDRQTDNLRATSVAIGRMRAGSLA